MTTAKFGIPNNAWMLVCVVFRALGHTKEDLQSIQKIEVLGRTALRLHNTVLALENLHDYTLLHVFQWRANTYRCKEDTSVLFFGGCWHQNVDGDWHPYALPLERERRVLLLDMHGKESARRRVMLGANGIWDYKFNADWEVGTTNAKTQTC